MTERSQGSAADAASSPESATPPLTYDIPSAVNRSRTSTTTIYEEMGSGRLRYYKVGARRYISHQALLEWIADRERETAAARATEAA